MASSPTKAHPPRLGTRWPWSVGSIRRIYRQKVEYVEDVAGIARYGVVQADVVAMGCTSRGQANRVGKWLLYSEQPESEIITFRTGLEGAVVRPGDVIQVADPSRGGMRLGGRIAAATTTSVTLAGPMFF